MQWKSFFLTPVGSRRIVRPHAAVELLLRLPTPRDNWIGSAPYTRIVPLWSLDVVCPREQLIRGISPALNLLHHELSKRSFKQLWNNGHISRPKPNRHNRAIHCPGLRIRIACRTLWQFAHGWRPYTLHLFLDRLSGCCVGGIHVAGYEAQHEPIRTRRF
jgi:hypothetical protein